MINHRHILSDLNQQPLVTFHPEKLVTFRPESLVNFPRNMQNGNAWGNWENFVGYTNTLMPYVSASVANVMGAIATAGEIVFGIALIIGCKTRLASLGSFLLTLGFALSMFFFADMRAPFSYSVFADSAASLLLAGIPFYRWSLDAVLWGKEN